MAASIFEEIGGGQAVEGAVEDFYRRVTEDIDLAPYFEGVDVGRLKAHQRAFLTAALGGPDRYEGVSMADAHMHLKINDEAFDAVVAHLRATLVHLGVPSDTVEAIAGRLAPLKSDIVSA